MTIKTCKFRIGDVYLFHTTDPSADLRKYNYWTFLPAEYQFCRLSTREELRDFSFNLNRN